MNTTSPPHAVPLALQDARLIAKYLRAIGEPTRVRILELVTERERSVGDLVGELGIPQPQVSNHLACLRWCGLVDNRRQHRHVFYRIADERVTSILATARGLLEACGDRVAGQRVDGAELK